MRFRNYLAAQYRTLDEIQTKNGKERKVLPIVTIYLLGFRLPNITSPAVKVGRGYINLMTRDSIPQKNEFIEQLSHDTYMVHLQRISEGAPVKGAKLNVKLEELLSVFEQKYFLNETGTIKDHSHEITHPVIKMMLDILPHAGVDPGKRKEIDDEKEAWRVIDAVNEQQMERLRNKLELKGQELERSRKENEGKEKDLEEKDKVLQAMAKKIEELERKQKGG